MATVVSLRVEVEEMGEVGLAALRQLFGLERLPLAPVRFALELKGAPTAVANALRRALLDELPGHCLRVPPDGYDCLNSDPLMLAQFVNHRIANIPLRPRIPPELEGLRLELDVTNESSVPRVVHAGDLRVEGGSKRPPPLFNPTHELALLQPGRRLRIRGIQVATGRGADDAAFQVGRRAVCRPLDLPQFEEAEIREKKGAACDASGFKVSTLEANPQHHEVSAWLPAAPAAGAAAEVRAVLARACASIRERLRHLAPVVDQKGAGRRGATYAAVRLESGLLEGTLRAPGETATIGELLRRTAFDLAPRLANIKWAPEEGGIVLTLSDRDATRVLAAAIERAEATFAAIQRGVEEVVPVVAARGAAAKKSEGPPAPRPAAEPAPGPPPAPGLPQGEPAPRRDRERKYAA
jgi:hypothetical protein